MSKRSKQPKPAHRTIDPPRKRATIGGLPTWAAAIVLAVSIVVVYGRALNVPLIFDDVDTVARNDSITRLWPPFGNESLRGPLNPQANLPTSARPLVNLSFALNYHFGGLNPTGYHAVNVVLHILSAILLYAIVCRTLRLPFFAGRFDSAAGWLALAAALLWALHPLQTETVIYATQRTELMMALFYLATIYCSLRYLTREDELTNRCVWLTLAILACFCGMASKEVMVSAPLIVLLFDRTLISGSLAAALRKSWPLYLGLTGTLLLLVALSVGSPHGGAAGLNLGPPLHIWWLTQAKIFWLYLKLTVWPSPLLIHYQLPYVDTIAGGIVYAVPLAVLGLTTLWLLWRNRPTGLLGTWYFALLAPTFIIPVVTEMAAERRMYLPLAALVILFVMGVNHLIAILRQLQTARSLSAPNWRLALCMLPLVFICGLASAKRLYTYQNPIELWRQVINAQPSNDIAHQQLGKHLDDAGDSTAAVAHFREAVRIDPASSRARLSLGSLLIKTHAPNEASIQFAEVVRLDPTDFRAYLNLSGALAAVDHDEEAVAVLRRSLQFAPDEWTIHNNLGAIFQKLGRKADAAKSFENVVRLKPDALDIYSDLADAYFEEHQPEKANDALNRGMKQARALGNVEFSEKFAARLRTKK